MIFRMCKIPLSEEKYETEEQRIHSIALKNGYQPKLIDGLIKKHEKRIEKANVPLKEEKKRISMHFDPKLHHSLSKFFEKFNVSLAPRSNTKIKQMLKSTKDRFAHSEKPGVYEAKCDDCEKT